MRSFGLLFPPGDRWVLLCWLLLCASSLAVLWSVTEPIRGPYQGPDPGVAKVVFWRQAAWVALSLVALSLAARLSMRTLENLAIPALLVMLALLLLILLVGPKISGSRRWFYLGPIRMQPAEFAKISFIMATAHFLGRSGQDRRSLGVILGTFCLMFLHMGLVQREPDLGTSLVFLAIWVGMVFWYGIPGVLLLGAGSAALSSVIMFYSESVVQQPWPWGVYVVVLMAVLYASGWGNPAKVTLLVLNVITGLGIPYFWEKLHNYQQERILTFFDPSRDQFGSGYQAIQSKVAIGSGGMFGTHYLQGTQKGLAFLPERHTDFIFSVVGEELGLFGAYVLLALYLTIILCGIRIATAARRSFWRYLAVGAVSYFTFHVVVNVAITTGLLPVTGLPLPLLSYGGSNLLTSSLVLGLLLNVSSRSFDS